MTTPSYSIQYSFPLQEGQKNPFSTETRFRGSRLTDTPCFAPLDPALALAVGDERPGGKNFS